MKRMTTEQFIDRAIAVHGDRYDYGRTEYVSSREAVVIDCPVHGEFQQRASSHLQGNGCPVCATDNRRSVKRELVSHKKRDTVSAFILKAQVVHDEKYDYSRVKYVNSRTKVEIVCPKHGSFLQTPSSHIQGHGCPKCGIDRICEKTLGTRSLSSWSPGARRKRELTNLQRYGAIRYLDSKEGRERLLQTLSSSEHRKKLSEINSSKKVLDKSRNTCMARYGYGSYMQQPSERVRMSQTMSDPEVRHQIYQTKKRNNSFVVSGPEQRLFELLIGTFGQDNVLRQHVDVRRYPFACDFYIPSEDLFIELNASWTHGGHFFDATSNDDIQTLSKWSNKKTAYYDNAVETWTVRDVLKRKTALDNNLRYVVFWDNNLSDAKAWLQRWIETHEI